MTEETRRISVEWGLPDDAADRPDLVDYMAERLYKTEMRHAFIPWDEAFADMQARYRAKARALLGYMVQPKA